MKRETISQALDNLSARHISETEFRQEFLGRLFAKRRGTLLNSKHATNLQCCGRFDAV